MTKLKILKKERLVIANRVIISKDTFIQIRNITRVWHGRPELNVPVVNFIVAFLIGTALINIPYLSLVGWLIITAVLLMAAYDVYILCNHSLNFELSSGEVYAFTSLNYEFIKQSYEKVKELMENLDMKKENYEINFNSCNIDIVKGDNNEIYKGNNIVVNKGDNSVVNANQIDNSQESIVDSFHTRTEIDYEMIAKELNILLRLPEVQSQKHDLDIIHEAQKNAEEKNAAGLKETLKRLSRKTMKLIEMSSSLLTVADFIKEFSNL